MCDAAYLESVAGVVPWIGCGVSADWNTSTTNWATSSGGTANVAFSNGDAVVFDNAATSFDLWPTTAVSPGAIFFANTGGFSHAFTIDGSGSYVVGGSGTPMLISGGGSVTLLGNNTFSGATTIASGSLTLGYFTSTGAVGGDIVDNDSLIFGNPSSQTYSHNISGSGSVTVNGGGTLTLTGTNTYTGATSVEVGTLLLGEGGSLGNTAITVSGYAQLSPQPGDSAVWAGDRDSGDAGAALALESWSTLDMTDGSIGAFDLLQETDFADPAATIDSVTFDFDVSADGADTVAIRGATYVSGTNTINLTGLGSSLPSAATFNLITADAGLSGTFKFGNGETLDTLTVGGQLYTLLLRNSDNAVSLTITQGQPNYMVFAGDTVSDGSTTVDFGTAYVNEPVVQTVTIVNTGEDPLTLSDPISLPSGVTLARDFDRHTLLPGEATWFAVQLDAAVEGTVSGNISFETSDGTLGTFTIPVSGVIASRVTGSSDPGFNSVGDGWTTVSNSGAVGGSELTADAGDGENVASWSFADLDPGKEYEVFATWTAASGQATNATYTILDGSNYQGPAGDDGTDTPNPAFVVDTLGTASVDQTAAPADVTVDGIHWDSLGSFTATSGVIEVDLSDDANGTVVAGGVRIVAVHENEAPVLQTIDDQTITAGDSFSVTAEAADPDLGDTLTYSIESGPPPGMAIDHETGEITWDTSSNTPPGDYRVTVQVTDDGTPAKSDWKIFTLTVDNENSIDDEGTGTPVVSVYSEGDAIEGGSPGFIRIFRTGDLDVPLSVDYQIDETGSDSAIYGTDEDYVGPTVTSIDDGIIKGRATFAANSATADVPIDASNDTSNKVNPKVDFQLLAYDAGSGSPLMNPGDRPYTLGNPATYLAQVIGGMLYEDGSFLIGRDQVKDVSFGRVNTVKNVPAGATLTYKIVAGNDEGAFALNGFRLYMTKNAMDAAQDSYPLTIEAKATFSDKTRTPQTVRAVITVNIVPTVGLFGDTMAVRNSPDTISLVFYRFTNDTTSSLRVYFDVDAHAADKTINTLRPWDLVDDAGRHSLLVNQYVDIPADARSVSLTLSAAALRDDEFAVGVRSFSVKLVDNSPAYRSVDAPVPMHDANGDKAHYEATCYILDGTTDFADDNVKPELRDADSSGVDINDVAQGALSDCYFMAAVMAVAKAKPQLIKNLISSHDGTYNVKLWDSDHHEWRNWDFSGQILTNGWSSARLSGDFDSFKNVEIWPQLLERAWALRLHDSYGEIENGNVVDAIKSLIGDVPVYDKSIAPGTHYQGIGDLISARIDGGDIVLVSTRARKPAEPPFELGGGAKVHLDHVYLVERIERTDGVVTGLRVFNPWGALKGSDYNVTIPAQFPNGGSTIDLFSEYIDRIVSFSQP